MVPFGEFNYCVERDVLKLCLFQPGEQLCRPFHYPHCSEQIARQEKPLLTEGACLQLCFSDYEKAILPSLRII